MSSNRHPLPDNENETGNYARFQCMDIVLPLQFSLLCSLLSLNLSAILHQFMCDLGRDHNGLRPNEKARTLLTEYFISRGYGQPQYTEAEIRIMLLELDRVSSLWPVTNDRKLTDLHVKWRRRYHRHWTSKWQRKAKLRAGALHTGTFIYARE